MSENEKSTSAATVSKRNDGCDGVKSSGCGSCGGCDSTAKVTYKIAGVSEESSREVGRLLDENGMGGFMNFFKPRAKK